ncbi:hypothetical protein GCM10011313_13720 [Mycetocola zhadangensis]|nr:hypothetical protein GCM10011313_13720 [Mycetocola zhadangensis]
MVPHHNGDGCHSLGHFTIFRRESLGRYGVEQRAQFPVACRTAARPIDKRSGIRKQGTHLLSRQGREHGPAGRGEVRREPHADIRDEVRTPRRALLDDVENVAPVHHGEVSTLPHPVDQVGEQRVAKPAQRLLAGESARQFKRCHSESIPAGFGQVHDKPSFLQDSEQVVNGGSGQIERGGKGRGSNRTTLGREVTENAKRGIRCWNLRTGHWSLPHHPWPGV